MHAWEMARLVGLEDQAFLSALEDQRCGGVAGQRASPGTKSEKSASPLEFAQNLLFSQALSEHTAVYD